MSKLKKTSVICAYLGLVLWITSTAFNAAELSDSDLGKRYFLAAAVAFLLYKIKSDSPENA